ncbi:MAG: hypothetical protein U0Z53_08915 [Blastocatellia bacterium]
MNYLKAVALASLLMLVLFQANCVSKGEVDKFKALDKRDEAHDKLIELHKPSMAMLMTEIQAHHSRLWFAGQAGNWLLAEHQLKGLQAAFEKAGFIYEKWEDVPKPLSTLIPLVTRNEIGKIREAIRAGNKTEFTASFERLTKDCNTCHRATDREFIVIQKPTAPGYTNLNYDPLAK